ncbi:MAG: hypothetical protein ACQKBY_00250 [Verrucomicrobiales bacterium]
MLKNIFLSFFLLAGSFTPSPAEELESSALRQLPQLTGREISFAKLVQLTRGHRIIPLDPENSVHGEIREAVLKAARECAHEFSAATSPLRQLSRINEASRHFEESLAQKLKALPGFTCGIPPTQDGKEQRSGYPDLRLVHQASGTIAYLDPKLFAAGSIASSLRTFYYEPTGDSGKINDDALHLLIGFPHNARDGQWQFSAPHLVDLSGLKVTLKAEFHASNRDLYTPKGENSASAGE